MWRAHAGISSEFRSSELLPVASVCLVIQISAFKFIFKLEYKGHLRKGAVGPDYYCCY